MNKLIVANWKMNPDNFAKAGKIVSAYRKSFKVDIVVCPPAVLLQQLAATHKKVTWGAQDCFWADAGAYTGQDSPKALKSIGAKYVIVGHSEQREFGKSTDEEIGKKVKAAIKNGVKPIFCVGGGPEAKRKNAPVKKIIKRHIAEVFRSIPKRGFSSNQIYIVYEPPWALSSVSGNKPAPMKFISETISYIRKILTTTYKLPPTSYKLLYGGSVNASNISSFFNQKYLDGFLVGGASLHPKEFNQIIRIVS